MGWFTRKKTDDDQRDPHLPLSVAQAQQLRELVRTAWANEGREVTVYPDHVKDADGGEFGLWNLAVRVAEAPSREWPGMVAEHVRQVVAPTPSMESMSDQELGDQVLVRLVSLDQVPDRSWFPHAPTLGDDLLQVLVVDTPTLVMTPQESAFAERGEARDWRAAGLANLWRLMRSEPRQHAELSNEGVGRFDVLMGQSVYTASMVLFLTELLSLTGHADQGRGVLVAMPFRHQVAFRVIDGPDAAAGLTNLFNFAMNGYDEGAGPVSPHVYWVRGDNWQRVTSRGEGRPMVEVPPELAEALEMTEQ